MNIALVGAGGKMGLRITNNLLKTDDQVDYVEVSETGIRQLQKLGLSTTPLDDAVSAADVIIMAVPDVLIGRIAEEVVPMMKEQALLMLLDPAAAYLNQLPEREDVAYFVTHPCHPPIYNDEITMEAKRDFFGGVAAKQAIVCALIQGQEDHYALGENMAKVIFSPVMRSHRISLEQMALLEPTMAETIGATCAILLRDAMNEAIRQGVPAEAARDFMLGHLNILLAVAFGEATNPLSDACMVAIEYGKKHLIQPGWEQLYSPESVQEQIRAMLS